MKLTKICFVLFFLTIVSALLSQNKIYFNKSGKSVSKDESYYYRVNVGQNLYKSYYTSNDNLYFEGEIITPSEADESVNKYKGTCKWYYKNGNIMYQRTYDDRGVLNGTSYEFYENGNIKNKFEYVNGKLKNNTFYEYTLEGDVYAVIEDRFSDNFNGWDLYNSNQSTSYFENNRLVIKSLTDAGTSRYVGIFNGNDDFIIESEINFTNSNKNESGGLIFGFKDWNNFYYFLLSGTSMHIGYVHEGMLFQKVEGMYCSSCKENDVNVMKVVQYNDKMAFSVNGEIQYVTNKIAFDGLNLGFALSGKNQISVNYLLFKYKHNESYANNDKNVTSTGTGVLISDNGYVITNEHVISNAKKIILKNNSKSYEAVLVKSDKINDLAVIKIKDSSFYKEKSFIVPFNIKENFNLEVGAYLWTIGYPLVLSGMGEEPKFSDGKLSAKTGYEDAINSFQTTIPVQPGNSGSPVFNENGELVGIISAKYKGADNVSYAIKSTLVRNLLDLISNPIPQINQKNLIKDLNQEDKIKKIKDFVFIIKITK